MSLPSNVREAKGGETQTNSKEVKMDSKQDATKQSDKSQSEWSLSSKKKEYSTSGDKAAKEKEQLTQEVTPEDDSWDPSMNAKLPEGNKRAPRRGRGRGSRGLWYPNMGVIMRPLPPRAERRSTSQNTPPPSKSEWLLSSKKKEYSTSGDKAAKEKEQLTQEVTPEDDSWDPSMKAKLPVGNIGAPRHGRGRGSRGLWYPNMGVIMRPIPPRAERRSTSQNTPPASKSEWSLSSKKKEYSTSGDKAAKEKEQLTQEVTPEDDSWDPSMKANLPEGNKGAPRRGRGRGSRGLWYPNMGAIMRPIPPRAERRSITRKEIRMQRLIQKTPPPSKNEWFLSSKKKEYSTSGDKAAKEKEQLTQEVTPEDDSWDPSMKAKLPVGNIEAPHHGRGRGSRGLWSPTMGAIMRTIPPRAERISIMQRQSQNISPPSKTPATAVEMPPDSVENNIGLLDGQFGVMELNDSSNESDQVSPPTPRHSPSPVQADKLLPHQSFETTQPNSTGPAFKPTRISSVGENTVVANRPPGVLPLFGAQYIMRQGGIPYFQRPMFYNGLLLMPQQRLAPHIFETTQPNSTGPTFKPTRISSVGENTVVANMPPGVLPLFGAQYIMRQGGIPYFQRPMFYNGLLLMRQQRLAPHISTGYYEMGYPTSPTGEGAQNNRNFGSFEITENTSPVQASSISQQSTGYYEMGYPTSPTGEGAQNNMNFGRIEITENTSPVQASSISQQSTGYYEMGYPTSPTGEGAQNNMNFGRIEITENTSPVQASSISQQSTGYYEVGYSTSPTGEGAQNNMNFGRFELTKNTSPVQASSISQESTGYYEMGYPSSTTIGGVQYNKPFGRFARSDNTSPVQASSISQQTYEKQGFHCATPPPLNLGSQNSGMGPGGGYTQHLFIPAMTPHHNTTTLMHQPIHQSTEESYLTNNVRTEALFLAGSEQLVESDDDEHSWHNEQ